MLIPAASPEPLPSSWIPDFPGWLGLATVEGNADADAPEFAAAHVAIPDSETDWTMIGTTKLRALAPGYQDDVVFSEEKEIRFGCDQTRATFSFFKGARRPPRGPVWLVPPGKEASVIGPVEILGELPAKIPGGARAKDADPSWRAWRFGDLIFVARRTESSLAEEIWRGEKRLWQSSSKWEPMSGGDDVPPSLDGGPGISIPQLLLVSRGASVLVVRRDGFEGINFWAHHIEKDVVTVSKESVYLYLCAF